MSTSLWSLVLLCGVTYSYVEAGVTTCQYLAPKERTDCGHPGMTQAQCEQRNCCFDSRIRRSIWCYHKPDNKYELIREEGTHDEATMKCLSRGMHLVRIDTSETQRNVEGYLAKEHVHQDVWTDGTRVGSRNKFVWYTQNREITYTNWDQGEPNNWHGKQNCVQLRHDRQWHWDDDMCHDKKYALCERD